ncbi:MAG: molybdopterin molybdotransferase MoeA [Deltaproteobacteria bacterium]|nr:molybdopterin molybdotransferase MoeA [Deltaproteobacteria bacterium]
MADWLKLIRADEARRILLDVPPMTTETVSLREAAGRVLALSLVAPHDLPPVRLAAMDGYAVRSADVRSASDEGGVVLQVVGAIPAGTVFAGVLGAGQAVGIATGGVIPDGADAVMMVEFTAPLESAGGAAGPGARNDVSGRSASRTYVPVGGAVRVSKMVQPGANVVMPGEDLREGAEILREGRRLRAGDLAALATFGMVDVPVYRRPRIAVLATGSEICPPHEIPRPGQVRDSNQYVLAAEVEAAGAIAVPAGIVADDLDVLQSTVLRLVNENDGLILSGGSSVGPKDLTARVLGALEAPGVLFHGIDIRPGKPTVFARAGRKPVVGMPGFPTSSMVVFEAFVRPMLARLGGEAITELDTWPGSLRARLTRVYSKPASREDYLRVRLSEHSGEIWADVLPGGSAAISNVIFADGLARIPAGTERLEEGASVAVRRFA